MHIAVLYHTFGGGAPTTGPTIPRAIPKLEVVPAGASPGAWQDITDQWRADVPFVCTYGIEGHHPIDRVANTGSLTFQLDNGARPGIPLGWSSVISASRQPGFNLNIPVRWSLGQAVGPRYYKFLGSLVDAIPDTGQYGERRSHCTALDWWDDAARMVTPDLPAQQNQRADQLVATLLDALPTQPTPRLPNRTIETGIETFPWSLDGGTGQRLTVRERIHQFALSEFGYAYLKGDQVTGGRFVFENQQHRSANPVTTFTLDDSMIVGMMAPGSRDDIYSNVQVSVHPTIVDATASAVLYSLQTSTFQVPAGQTNTSLFGPYRDEVSADLIGATGQLQPVPNTDYTMNSAQDGTGTDLTGAFPVGSVVASFTGVGVRFTITNTGGQDAYITKLQVRGRRITRVVTILESTVVRGYTDRTLEFDMPFQGSINTGSDIATFLAEVYAQPYANIEWVKFCATKSSALFQAAMEREPGDRIVLSEAVTGIEGQPFTINRVTLECTPTVLWCTWGLEQASAQQFWMLGTAGFGELGISTTLGF